MKELFKIISYDFNDKIRDIKKFNTYDECIKKYLKIKKEEEEKNISELSHVVVTKDVDCVNTLIFKKYFFDTNKEDKAFIEFDEVINNLSKALKDTDNYLKKIRKEVSMYDREISSLEHTIEACNLRELKDEEKIILVNEMTSILEKRRLKKDKMLILSDFNRGFFLDKARGMTHIAERIKNKAKSYENQQINYRNKLKKENKDLKLYEDIKIFPYSGKSIKSKEVALQAFKNRHQVTLVVDDIENKRFVGYIPIKEKTKEKNEKVEEKNQENRDNKNNKKESFEKMMRDYKKNQKYKNKGGHR